jgi:hypothetical protein
MTPLELPFKGKRNYFHGTDLLPALLQLAAAPNSSTQIAQEPLAQTISVQFHRLATRPVHATWVDADELQALRSADALVALLSLRAPERHLAVTERSQAAVQAKAEAEAQAEAKAHAEAEAAAQALITRVDWDEAATVQNAHCGPEGHWHLAVPRGSLVQLFEHVIALNKQVLNTQFGPQDWLWARVDLPNWRPPQSQGTLEIAFLRQIRGSVFVSEARFDKVPLASIYFAKKTPATA